MWMNINGLSFRWIHPVLFEFDAKYAKYVPSNTIEGSQSFFGIKKRRLPNEQTLGKS
jgi:hypothetical protein